MPYANTSKPNGFVPYNRAPGAANKVPRPVPAVRTASTGGNASTDLALGDAYALDANGNAYRAGPGDVIRGVVVGFEFQASPLNPSDSAVNSTNYITGNGNQTGTTQIASLIGIEDNACLFECQSDTFAASNTDGLFSIVDAAPDSFYRISQQKISVGGGAGIQVKTVALKLSPEDNAFGANARVIVQFPQMNAA